MSAQRPTARAAACLVLTALFGHAQEQTSGVNLTASEGFGARHLGMALTRAGFAQGADAVINAPASMNDVNDFTFTTAHAEQFGLAKFDNFAMLIPWHARSTLGIGFARYAVSDIPGYDATPGSTMPAEPDALFGTSDWMVTGSFARRFGSPAHAFDVGGSAHLLSRRIEDDQSGFGLRGDAMAQYTLDGRLRTGAFVRGLVPSSAAWSEGLLEYEAPEAVLFIAVRRDMPYFYGSLQAGFETPGLLQPGARSSSGLEGERGVTDPLSALKTSKAGAEFNFNFGLSLRAGFDEIAPGAWTSSARLGMGYNWRNILAIDYAFAAHPYLDESHRVALRFTPSFPRFEGRNFRPGDRVFVPRENLRPTYPSPYTPAPDASPAPEVGTPPVTPATPGTPAVPEAQPAPRNETGKQPDPAPAAPAEEELEEGEILETQ
jgi:hypothetical protein